MTIPCRCCPTSLARCWAPENPLACNLPPTVTPLPTVASPTSAAVIANPLGWTFAGTLSVTFDGNLAGGSFWRINNGNTPATQVGVRWTFDAGDVERAYAFRVYHGGGGILNDGDGIASATLTVRNAALTPLFAGPIVTGNSGAGWITDFSPPGPFDTVRHFDLTAISKPVGGAPNVHIREVEILQRWAADITYVCPPFTFTARAVADTDTQAGGITTPAGQLNQTNGPHTLTWSAAPGVTGTVTTNNPGNFSTLTITDGSTMVIAGNQVNTFDVEWVADDLDEAALPAHGLMCDGAVTWYDTDGNALPVGLLRDCP